MKELELKFPSSWDEVTLKMHTEITLAEGNVFEKVPVLLEILTGEDRETFKKLPATFVVTSGLEQKLAFMQKQPIPRAPSEKLTLNGTEYKVGLYPQKWTAGQWLDYNAVLSQEMPAGDNRKIAMIIACFAVPMGHEYGDGYDFDSVVDEIYKYMPITVALGYASFFALLLQSFAKALAAYTEKKNKKSTRRPGSRSKGKRNPEKDSTRSGTPS